MEAFDISVFPWRSRLDITQADLAGFSPLLNPFGYELGTIVASHVFRFPSAAYEDLLQGVEDPSGRIPAVLDRIQTGDKLIEVR